MTMTMDEAEEIKTMLNQHLGTTRANIDEIKRLIDKATVSTESDKKAEEFLKKRIKKKFEQINEWFME